jgi:anti-sigma B factor antagonist
MKFDLATLLRLLPSSRFKVKSCPLAYKDPTLSFTIQIRQAGKVTLMDVSGRLTSFEGQAFRDAIQRLLRKGENNIVLNLKGLDYLDSSGVGELVRNYLAVIKKGGAMKVVGLAPKVEEILKVTQLYQVFPEFPDEQSALESFPKPGRTANS